MKAQKILGSHCVESLRGCCSAFTAGPENLKRTAARSNQQGRPVPLPAWSNGSASTKSAARWVRGPLASAQSSRHQRSARGLLAGISPPAVCFRALLSRLSCLARPNRRRRHVGASQRLVPLRRRSAAAQPLACAARRVKYAVNTDTNERVAIKILDKEKIQKQNMGEQIKKARTAGSQSHLRSRPYWRPARGGPDGARGGRRWRL